MEMLETLWNEINPYIWQMLAAALATIVTYVGIKIKNLYQKKINTETKKEIVKSVVQMVENIAKKYGWNSYEKYEKAKETVLELLNNEGIKITELELEVLIESVCKALEESMKS